MDKDLFTLHTEHFTLEGRSRAGHETFFRIRDLGVALDIGRCPDLLVPMGHVFITHAHLDHAAGMAFWAGQRRLQGLRGGTLYVPAEVADDVRALFAIQRRLADRDFDVEIRGLAAGDEVRFGRSHVARAYDAPHRVAARAYEFIEVRHHLREEFAGREDVGWLRRDGVQVDEEYRSPLLFYTGDTDRGIFESTPELFKTEVLIVECSFVKEGHQERAATYRHIHLDDIADYASRFENQLLVLSHFSRRYSRTEIRDAVKARLPQSLLERVRLVL